MNHTLTVICMTLALTALSIAGTISLNVMAKDNAVGSYRCFPQDNGESVLCCQLFQGGGDYKWFCTYCDNTSPPSNCLPRFEARNEGGDIVVPTQDGVSDDPQAGEDRNPAIPPIIIQMTICSTGCSLPRSTSHHGLRSFSRVCVCVPLP